jgi:lysophospholipase L1-like esterase
LEKLGTTGAKPDLGWQFTVGLAAPAERDCWVIIDRLGAEGPEFIANPPVTPTAGPDPTINTKDVAGNAAVLAPAVQRLKAKTPFKIVAFGDSVTAGAQATRGNWDVKPPDAVKYLYFAHLARLLEERYGYAGITPVQCGFGGWTAEKAKTIVAKEMEKAGPDDVVILEFGANDLGWAYKDVNRYIGNMRDLIAEAKKKTSQIIIMSPTTGGNVPSLADEISRGIRKLAEEQKVAYVDITKWSLYRGEKFAWAYLANDYHPDFMGHIMIGELMLPLFTGENFDWPQYVKK